MLTRRFLTVKEVADLVQVSEASVRHWIKMQQLRAIDLGREWRVIPRDLEAFLATHATSRAASLPAEVGGGPTVVPASSSEISSDPGMTGQNPVARGAVIRPVRPPQGANRDKEKRNAGE
jgi:excisionase family DNA binding protein